MHVAKILYMNYTQGLINVNSLQAQMEGVRPKGVQEGTANLLPTSKGVWESAVSSPSEVSNVMHFSPKP